MTLPKVEIPKFVVTLPVSKQKVTFRPYTVKEQEIILESTDSENRETFYEICSDIIESCTFGKIQPDTLCKVDFEILFIHIRARSVKEDIDLNFKCENKINDKSCNGVVPVSINLLNIPVIFPKGEWDGNIKVCDEWGFTLKPLTMSIIKQYDNKNNIKLRELVKNSIEKIYKSDGEIITEWSDEEFNDWYKALPFDVGNKITECLQNQPTMKLEVKSKCTICKKEHIYYVSDLQNFFPF